MGAAWPDPATNDRFYTWRFTYHDLAAGSQVNFTNDQPWTLIVLGWSFTSTNILAVAAGWIGVIPEAEPQCIIDGFGYTDLPVGAFYRNGDLFVALGPAEQGFIANAPATTDDADVAAWGVFSPVAVQATGT